jgi:hypothetical protein
MYITRVHHLVCLQNSAAPSLRDHIHGSLSSLGSCQGSCQILSQAHELAKIKVGWDCHFIRLAIGYELKGQIQNGSGMAAIHDARDSDTSRHGPHQNLKQVVVANLTRRSIIHRYQGLVVSVLCSYQHQLAR